MCEILLKAEGAQDEDTVDWTSFVVTFSHGN